MIEDKVSLAAKRAELVQILVAPLSTEDRVRIQGELAVINAKIKAINTTTAAQLKAAADRRKVAGLAEAQANAARARAHLNGSGNACPIEPEDDDPGQTAAIDGWIDAVLLRHDVEFTRSRTGKLTLPTAPKILTVLIDGIYAAARGQELPDLPPAASKAPAPKAKPKKR
jgi:hypothetical protein